MVWNIDYLWQTPQSLWLIVCDSMLLHTSAWQDKIVNSVLAIETDFGLDLEPWPCWKITEYLSSLDSLIALLLFPGSLPLSKIIIEKVEILLPISRKTYSTGRIPTITSSHKSLNNETLVKFPCLWSFSFHTFHPSMSMRLFPRTFTPQHGTSSTPV